MKVTLRSALAIWMLTAWGVASAADPLVVDLQERLASTDVAAVNAYLSANWETKMSQLGRLVRRCDDGALRLSLSLLDTTNLEALQGHVYSLELAMRKCPEKLLPLVPASKVKSLCAVDAFAEMHPAVKLAAEIDRRVAHVRKLGQLASSPVGQACLDSYAAARQVQK
jgi:hypothetical protein